MMTNGEVQSLPPLRPLAHDGWGPERHRRRAVRCAAYYTAGPIRLEGRGAAAVRLDFPRARGKGPARTDAARALAAAYGVEARSLYTWHRSPDGTETPVREDRAVTLHGRAEDVARAVEGLRRLLDYAETLATQAARAYGQWARSPRAEAFLEYTDASVRRDLARRFRATAYRAVVGVLAADRPEDTAPVLDDALPFFEHAAAYAAGLAVYGWIPAAEEVDEDAAAQILAAALPLDERHQAEARQLAEDAAHRSAALTAALDGAELAPAAVEDGQLALWAGEGEAPQTAGAPGPVVVIPCSGVKLDRPAPAGVLYTGSLHRMARRAADALTADGGTILVLSGRHGLLRLTDVIAPYETRLGEAGSVTPAHLAAQAAALGLAAAERVTVLAPKAYTAAALTVWPHARTPLTGSRGIGEQRGRLAHITRAASAPATFALAA